MEVVQADSVGGSADGSSGGSADGCVSVSDGVGGTAGASSGQHADASQANSSQQARQAVHQQQTANMQMFLSRMASSHNVSGTGPTASEIDQFQSMMQQMQSSMSPMLQDLLHQNAIAAVQARWS